MAKPVGKWNMMPQQPLRDIPDDRKLINTETLGGGMVTDLLSTVIKPEELSLVKNARIRFGKTLRKPGMVLLTPTKPDSNEIRKLFLVTYNPTKSYLLRITNASAHYSLNGGNWTALSGHVPLSSTRFIDCTIVLGIPILTNGANRPQKIDFIANTVSDVSADASVCKYGTGFAERFVGANLGDDPEAASSIMWSANRNIAIYDAAADPSAGQKPLVFSSAKAIDPITGIFGLTSVMIITRAESIWLATKSSIARDPFNCYSTGNIGFDCQGSIQLGNTGIYGYSQKQNAAYFYSPGMEEPLNISKDKISKQLAAIDADKIISGFNASKLTGGEYYLGFRQADSSTKMWTFNESSRGWSYDEYPASSEIAVIDVVGDYTAFEDLVGLFSGLSGAFEDLSGTPVATPTLMIGKTNGDVLVEDATKTIDDNAGTAYETEIRSANFTAPKEDILFSRIRVDYEAIVSGDILIEYSKNGGDSWTTVKTITTVVNSDEPQFIKIIKSIKTRTLMWRIKTSDGLTNFLRHEIYVTAGGESQR